MNKQLATFVSENSKEFNDYFVIVYDSEEFLQEEFTGRVFGSKDIATKAIELIEDEETRKHQFIDSVNGFIDMIIESIKDAFFSYLTDLETLDEDTETKEGSGIIIH